MPEAESGIMKPIVRTGIMDTGGLFYPEIPTSMPEGVAVQEDQEEATG